MIYDELTKALFAKLGITPPVQEDGVCSIEIDGMIVSLVEADVDNALLLHGIVGDPPPAADDRFGALLLQANHLFQGTGGATLSQDPESREYALQRQLPLVLLDADSLVAELERFVNSLERWRHLLADFRPVEEEALKLAADENLPPLAFEDDGFISV